MKPERIPKRGAAAQDRKRDLERSARIDVLAFAHWTGLHELSQRESARRLGIRPGTLAAWQREWKSSRLVSEPLGRPCRDSDRETRNLIIALFNLVGPGIGLPCLRAFFPDAAKGELEDLLRRYRRVHLRRNGVVLHVLRWHHPGAVWAMDFHKPAQPVDGIYPYVFLVRDLASGKQLLSLPVPSRELHHVVAALTACFNAYGAPLVMKSDCEFDTACNPAYLDDEEVRATQLLADLLATNHVIGLLSPPYTPEYNAAIEAGIGSFQTRAHHEAARHGHPGQWNCDDVEAARLQANELARPWGHDADTPDTAWIERKPIDAEDRRAFQTSVQQFDTEARLDKQQERNQESLFEVPLSRKELSSCRREAISRALVKHGFLSFKRRRFTLPLKRVLWSNIS